MLKKLNEASPALIQKEVCPETLLKLVMEDIFIFSLLNCVLNMGIVLFIHLLCRLFYLYG
jgi:hypothetical protein